MSGRSLGGPAALPFGDGEDCDEGGGGDGGGGYDDKDDDDDHLESGNSMMSQGGTKCVGLARC